jgi:lipopolysaccharide export system permease protein
MLKIYKKYLIKKYLSYLLQISMIFFILSIIMGLVEELKFFTDIEAEYYLPYLLIVLNIPNLIYEIFPFCILLAIIWFFLSLKNNNELSTFKYNGLNNSKLLILLTSVTLFIGFLMIVIFYNFSAILKKNYLDIKKSYTNDNKYLASITENGLWIKDENIDNIFFVNASSIDKNQLMNVNIILLDKNFRYLSMIFANNIDIENNEWQIKNASILDVNNKLTSKKNIEFKTNFNFEKINSLYTNLYALSIWELYKLKKDYESVNYSTADIDLHFQKILSYPFFLTVMSILSCVFMMNIQNFDNKIFVFTFGIILSVSIYYINNFFSILGKSEKIPITFSVWIPILILFIISLIGVVRINEK